MYNITTNFWNIITNPHFYVVIILIIIVVAITHHVQIKSAEKTGKKVTIGAEIIKPGLNYRQILYILIYVYYGYHFPHYFIEFLIMAILFKFIDKGVCSDSFLQAFKCDNWNALKDKISCRIMYAVGSCTYDHTWSDVMLNMAGFVLGSLIFRIVHHHKKF